MEFRTCPACQASVLEDDAVDCPFCGASMTTGKPSGQAQAPTKKAEASPPSASGEVQAPASGKAPSGKAKTPAKKSAAKADDSADPFDVDTSAARKASPVRPRPAKGYMTRVTCPMCETPGFISEAQIGKEVKCANRECLVPVFVADPPKIEEPEPEPEPEGSGKLWLYVGLAVVVIAWSGGDDVSEGSEAAAGFRTDHSP